MRAGDLDQRVTIERRVDAPDGGGGFEETWETLATVWAMVETRSGREESIAGGLRAIGQRLVTIHVRADVTTANRLRWKDEILEIEDIGYPKGPRGAAMLLDCRSGVLT